MPVQLELTRFRSPHTVRPYMATERVEIAMPRASGMGAHRWNSLRFGDQFGLAK
ncbi:MAG: hypothetical protein LH645_10375 [Actinomycetia bacterium]|nr:hypothetical protein [Actinomycetes bacterium]